MIKKNLLDIQRAWQKAKTELYSEIRNDFGKEFLNSLQDEERYNLLEERWTKTFGSKLFITEWFKEPVEKIPHVQFVDESQYMLFMLRYS